MKILIIEDDRDVAAYIVKGFTDSGHEAHACYDGAEGLTLAQEGAYDLLILDRMLPSLEGLEIIRTLRAAQNNIPVIILSALSEVDDRVQGLKAGGDDYLVKPFAFSELLARAEALSRRHQVDHDLVTSLSADDLHMDLLTRNVTRRGVVITLQAREFSLLEYLLRNKGQIVTRTMLLENVWHYHFDPQTNVIDVHISRLRRKVDDPFKSTLIKTIRGSGYTIDA